MNRLVMAGNAFASRALCQTGSFSQSERLEFETWERSESNQRSSSTTDLFRSQCRSVSSVKL